MSTIYVPTGFSWVAASLVSVAIVLQWQRISVGNARKKASIPYPQAYAEKAEQESSMDAKIFNCKQRAHQNTLENAPVMVVS
jgi:glutathione S-transferase